MKSTRNHTVFMACILMLLCSSSLLSQISGGFNFQAVARDGSGSILSQKPLSVEISIHSGSAGGTVVWKENHQVTTNDFGIFTITICSSDDNRTGGTASKPDEINWGSSPHFIQVRADAGSGMQDLGTTELLSVPYALYAGKSPESQELSFLGTTLALSSGNSVDLSALVNDADADPENEIQDLVLNGDQLTISKDPNTSVVNLKTYTTAAAGWTRSGDVVSYTEGNVGVGTVSPEGRLSVRAVDETPDIPLFQVLRKDGYPVFAVYEDGVWVYTDTAESAKGVKGGFAVGGYRKNKALTDEYMRVTADSIRFYIEPDDPVKGVKGGFAVGGYRNTKTTDSDEFLRVTADSVRVYIDDDPLNKGVKGGFAVGGYKTSQKGNAEYFNISGNTTADKILNENRLIWYPLRNAFITGKILIQHADSVGENSMASGYQSLAKGNYSEAFGYQAKARGEYAMAIGKNAEANGAGSMALGQASIAKGDNSFAFGQDALALQEASFAMGSGALALGPKSYAFGSMGIDSTGTVTGETVASGESSYAFGLGCRSTGLGSIAFGANDTASGNFSLAMGYKTRSTDNYSTSLGAYTEATQNYALASGFHTVSGGNASFTTGAYTLATGSYSMATGYKNEATSMYATAIGYDNRASGTGSFSTGCQTTAGSSYTLSTGYRTQATGSYSSSFGNNAIASGTASSAFGYYTTASNSYALAAGYRSNASGIYATALGGYCDASNYAAFATGYHTLASGYYSVSLGYYSTAQAYGSLVIGRYNVVEGSMAGWYSNEPLLVAGNGTNAYPQNALTLYKNGNMTILGTLTELSDVRLKKNILPLESVLGRLRQVRPVYFEFLRQDISPQGKQIGVVAQELETLFPELVSEDASGYLSVDYSRISVVLVQALREQQEIIDRQEEDNIVLRTELEEMKKELAEIRALLDK